MALHEFKKSKLTKIILKELSRKRFISGDEFYKKLSKELNEFEDIIAPEAYKELEKLFEKGKIIRYELNYPNNLENKRKANDFPRYLYTLQKQK